MLIIDDDSGTRERVRLMLKAVDYDVVEAANGLQGVRVQDKNPADLVFCDLFMPRMEGLETIRALQARHPATPIIATRGGSAAVPGDDA